MKMPLRAVLHRIVTSLTRPQKRAVFLAADMLLAPLIAGLIFFPVSSETVAQMSLLLPGLLAVAAMASISVGLPKIKLIAYEIQAIVATGRFAALVTLGLAVLCQVLDIAYDAVILAEFMTALLCCAVAGRFIMLGALRWVLRTGKMRRRVLIYGAGDTGLQLAAALRSQPHIQPVAFLDDNVDLQAMTVGGLPVLSPHRIEAIVQKQHVDSVLLAMPLISERKRLQISQTLRALGLDVQIIPSLSELAGTDKPISPATNGATGAFLGRCSVGEVLPNLGEAYKDRVVLVSGAGGSVGSELCRHLLKHRPKRLVLFERSEIALYTIDAELRDLAAGCGVDIASVLGSVTDSTQSRATFIDCGVEVVFHTAAYKHVSLVEANPIAGLANNVIGTRVFVEAAQAAGVERFVLISTDKAVRPTSIMGATKRLAELVVQDLATRSPDTHFSIVRFGNVLGSSGSVLPRFREQIARGGPITLTDDNVTRYFMTISEAAQLVLVAGALCARDAPELASVFALDMGRPVRIRDLAERMVRAEGLRPYSAGQFEGDIEIILTGLLPGEKLHEELFIGENLLRTPHPKILRATEGCLSEFAVASALCAARRAIASGDQDAAREIFSKWVEGFPAPTAKPTDNRQQSMASIN